MTYEVHYRQEMEGGGTQMFASSWDDLAEAEEQAFKMAREHGHAVIYKRIKTVKFEVTESEPTPVSVGNL